MSEKFPGLGPADADAGLIAAHDQAAAAVADALGAAATTAAAVVEFARLSSELGPKVTGGTFAAEWIAAVTEHAGALAELAERAACTPLRAP